MNKFESPGKIIKQIALLGGITAVTIGGINQKDRIVNAIEQLAPKENIEIHKSMGIIFKKIYNPAGTSGTIKGVNVPGLTPLLMRAFNEKENWNAEIKVDGRLITTPITKQQFDTLVEGKECSVVYKTTKDNQQGWIDSIAGEQIKY